ncbi:MAG: helix-turn-helix transcriptional regulator [Eubacteriales bacterium]|nr:helix-turn-helix transcriptional regulator [Eubacteriales bacterium]
MSDINERKNRVFAWKDRESLEELARRNQAQVDLPLSEELRDCCDIREYLSIIIDEYNEVIRKEKRFTREDLAKRIHPAPEKTLSYGMIRKYFSNGRFPSRDFMLSLCAALHMDVPQTDKAMDLLEFSRLYPESSNRDRIISDYLQKYCFSGGAGRVDENRGKEQALLNELLESEREDPLLKESRSNRSLAQPLPEGENLKVYSRSLFSVSHSLLMRFDPSYLDLGVSIDFKDDVNRFCLYQDSTGVYRLIKENGTVSMIPEKKIAETLKKPDIPFSDVLDLHQCVNRLSLEYKKQLKNAVEAFGDTKNFGKRAAARVENRNLALYGEVFVTSCPECSRYLQIRITSKGVKYSLSHASLFSRWYLAPSVYKAFYGSHAKEEPVREWDSLSEVKKGAEEELRVRNDDAFWMHGEDHLEEILPAFQDLQSYLRHLYDSLLESLDSKDEDGTYLFAVPKAIHFDASLLSYYLTLDDIPRSYIKTASAEDIAMNMVTADEEAFHAAYPNGLTEADKEALVAAYLDGAEEAEDAGEKRHYPETKEEVDGAYRYLTDAYGLSQDDLLRAWELGIWDLKEAAAIKKKYASITDFVKAFQPALPAEV